MGSRLEKNSDAVRKKIESHAFDNEEGEEYEGSKFGGFADYFRRKKIKLQNLDAELRSYSAGTPQIFKGIVAHVNGYTQPSLNDLHRMIVIHGGGFMQYLDGKTTVTHIIAANLTPKKAVEFKRYRIVKPAWIVESIESGKILPWENYRVVDEGVSQRLLVFNDGKIASEAPTQLRTYREQTKGSWYTNQMKRVADDIDEDGGHRFPSSQRVMANGSNAYFSQKSSTQGDDSLKPKLELAEPANLEPDPSNPESFSVSSSLEDALNAADAKSAPEQQDEEEATPQLDETMEVPIKGGVEDVPRGKIRVSETPDYRKHYLPLYSPSPPKKARVMTAEEHNAILLADPHIRKSSTANPDFLKQFYSESRLHHLSAWKSDLKARLQQMAAEKSLSQKQAQKRKPGLRRYIMHVDFDSFFCAVSLKSAPEYADKPAVVAHGTGLGSEIASCNYPARAFGVKNGMWMKKALELCPDIKVLPYDFPAYEEASRLFYLAILDVGGIVQSVSVDEALVDISSLCLPAGESNEYGVSEESILREQAKADQMAENLRQRIKEKTGCAVSVGLGGSILLAKVALRKAKPAGQYQIKPEKVLDFVGDLLVRDLPGVAHSIGGKLDEIGVTYVKDVRSLSKDRLMTVLGPKTGQKIWDYSRGVDDTEVGEQVIRKSVSAEVNWGIRFINQPEAEEFVQNLCGELQKRLIDSGVKGRHLIVKIMRRAGDAPLDPPKHLGHGKCDTFNKSIVLGVATNSSETIGREAVSILRSYGFSPGELRGLGVQMTKLEPLKAAVDGNPNGSQRRITFNAAGPKLLRKETAEDPITDPDSPRKPKTTQVHPASIITRANAADLSAKKPLNLLGTQFILPTQIDPTVLAQLPQDIRSKLLAQSKSAPASRTQSRAPSPTIGSRPPSPSPPSLPPHLDPEVFAALPSDVQEEIRASYISHDSLSRGQSLLPQSPRKVRTLTAPKKSTTPTKKRGRRPLFHDRGKLNITNSNTATLTQSNFVIGTRAGESIQPKSHTSAAIADADETSLAAPPDPDFLAALPADVRVEVLAEHRRAILAHRSHLSVAAPKPRPGPDAPEPQRTIRLPPRPAKPTFTTARLSELPQLRDTLREWHREFAEGPHGEDVAALERYLRRVVVDGRDVGRAAAVVRWLNWVVDEDVDGEEEGEDGDGGEEGDIDGEDAGNGDSGEKGRRESKNKRNREREHSRQAWEQALRGIKARVQDAVAERGFGRLDL